MEKTKQIRSRNICFLFLTVFFYPGYVFSQQTNLPMPDHIVVVILENHGYAQIIGSSSAPHINALANDIHSALFTQSYAIEHPSQPNYLDLFAGCDQGIMDDSKPTNTPFTTDNLARQLLDAGRTFITYSEGLPGVGYDGTGSGNYARKHNPAANWMGTGPNQIATSTNQPFTAFPTDFTLLPTVCFVIPNLIDDMHDGGDPATIINGDKWVYQNLTSYIQWAQAHNSLLILTFDEDELSQSNQVATIFNGSMIKPGQYPEKIDHYSILRTVEDMYGLQYACNAATANTISDSWILSSVVMSNESLSGENVFSIYPNPASGEFSFEITGSRVGKVESLEIFDALGNKVFEKSVADDVPVKKILLTHFSSGSYLVKVSDGRSVYTQKLVVQ